ncbi:hypothetical protein FQA39_LY18571 [Lamprigera yunnana]|nr:hypothetical protein FQA39_LY18571 [Lamprigera yunnana]
MLVLFVFAVLLDLGDSALIPLTKGEDSVRSCMKRIIEVYADDSTTVFSFLHERNKSYLWHFDIPDAIVLVYDYSLRSNFTEVFISNRLHPSNRCGALVKNMSRFSCNMINKAWKQQFFRNYNKCRVTYRYELSETVNNKKNYITEIVLSEIVSTLNLTFFKKPKSINVAANDNYLLSSTNMRSCILKSMFCGVTFMEDVLVWTIPSPKKLDSLEVFKLIFKWNSWILIFLSFIFTSFMWWAISSCKSLTGSSAVLNVYSLTLMVAIPTVSKCFPLRCLFVTYVIYAIHIQTGFTSNLVNLLTVPQYSVIKTIEELVDTNLPILIPHRSANILLNMTHESNQIFGKMKKNIMVLPDKEWSRSMENLQLLENSSIMTSTENVRVMVNSLKKKVNFLIDMDQTLVKNELYTFTTRQGSCIIQDANKVINILIESGILNYQKNIYHRMEKEYAMYYEEMQNSDEKIVLGMKHVYPIFLFWGVGMLLATVAFILEHVTYNVKNK